MGSSPVTATILSILDSFFRQVAVHGPGTPGSGDAVVVAFSGGPDSTALLLGLTRLGRFPAVPIAPVIAAHLDHGLDPGSAERAAAASRLAGRLGVRFVSERREARQRGESPEAAARRERYGFLEEVRQREGARWIATGHHRDDQAETVLLRLLFGSGWEGLAGIRPVHGSVVRPLLKATRRDLRTMVEEAGLVPVEDPTNLDLATPRNRVRALMREAGEDSLSLLLERVADRARGASARLDRYLSGRLRVQQVADGLAIDRAGLEGLPAELLSFALAWLHRLAGASYPPSAAARSELSRQMASGLQVGCDSGDGWRWEATGAGDEVILRRASGIRRRSRERAPDFSYTVATPDLPDS